MARNPLSLFRPGASLAVALALPLFIAGCGGDDEPEGPMHSDRSTLITVEQPVVRDVDVTERTMARLRARTAPTIRAEVSSRVLALHVEEGNTVSAGDLLATLDPEPYTLLRNAARGDRDRLAAMVRNQHRQVERLERQAARDYVSDSEMDAAQTQLDELEGRLASAQAQLETAERNLRLTRVTAPVSGRVTQRHISDGDLPNIGEPLFALVAPEALQAILPFPETATGRIEPGMMVRLTLPARPDAIHEAPIVALREQVGEASRAFDALVNLDNPGGWQHGASVTADVIRETRLDGVTISEVALVLRPSGPVVYTIEDDTAVENVVEVGFRHNGWLEIRSGLDADAVVASDGAHFLSDGAAVRIRSDNGGERDQ